MDISLVTIYLIIFILSALYSLLKRTFSYWKDRGIPHDKPSMLYGNLEGVGKTKHFSNLMSELYNKYKNTGPFCGAYVLVSPIAVICDLDLMKNILIKDFSNFADRGMFCNPRDDPLTGHLFALDGPKWKSLRSKLSPTFTSGKMKFMFPTIVTIGHQFSDTLGELVDLNDIIEIKEILARFTTDVIGTCAFGIDCNSLKDPNTEFRVMSKRVFTEHRHTQLFEGIMHSFPKLAQFLRIKFNIDEVEDFFIGIVKETVEYREKNNIQRNDFMNMLIELKNGKSDGDKEAEGLTMNEVAAQAFIFFLAGFETSSTTMGFCLLELAQNIDIQEKVRKEINEVLDKYNGEMTYESMKEMPYLDQVIFETLRKYPVLTNLMRKALNDYKVPDTDIVIEKGTLTVLPIEAVQNDPDIYPEPEKFNPDRFLPEEIQKRHTSTWLSFGQGPRNCIGLRFGKMQARIGLVTLLRNFQFLPCDKTMYPPTFDCKAFLLSTKGGIFLKVNRL